MYKIKPTFLIFFVILLFFQIALALDANKYHGGSADGFAMGTSASDIPLFLLLTSKYHGGSSDGFAMGTSASDIGLPVELVSFTAAAGDGQVTLKWVTQSEINNLGFILERSYNNTQNFQEIASYNSTEALKGQGNTTLVTKYIYTDKTVQNSLTYYYRLIDVAFNGSRTIHGTVTSTPGDQEVTPSRFYLHQNYPNPFNPVTNIKYEIPNLSDGTAVAELTIYNSLGQKIKTLHAGPISGGVYEAEWNGKNDRDFRQPCGVYYIYFKAGDYAHVRNMLLIK